MLTTSSALLLLALVRAHGGHHHFDPAADDAGLTYAERHMHQEHHIDSFDLTSFFKLHDFNNDGQWDSAEIEAVYGLHHHSVKDKMPADHVDSRAEVVVNKVLDRLDTDKDGKVSEAEFLAGGREGLPSFEGYKDLGHHYDEESEYFLHHEELYHSTPETQTDESYTHPEDIEHFRHHQHIEDEEDERERKFEGLPENADLGADHPAADPLDEHAHAPGEGPDQTAFNAPSAKTTRAVPGAAPHRINDADDEAKLSLKEAAEKAKGQVRSGHGTPRSPEERLKAGVPYKYKSVAPHFTMPDPRADQYRMRKGLRADEF